MIHGKMCPFTFFGRVYESTFTLLDTVTVTLTLALYRIVSDLVNRERDYLR